jgi:hypothetical protein
MPSLLFTNQTLELFVKIRGAIRGNSWINFMGISEAVQQSIDKPIVETRGAIRGKSWIYFMGISEAVQQSIYKPIAETRGAICGNSWRCFNGVRGSFRRCYSWIFVDIFYGISGLVHGSP